MTPEELKAFSDHERDVHDKNLNVFVLVGIVAKYLTKGALTPADSTTNMLLETVLLDPEVAVTFTRLMFLVPTNPIATLGIYLVKNPGPLSEQMQDVINKLQAKIATDNLASQFATEREIVAKAKTSKSLLTKAKEAFTFGFKVNSSNN